MISVKQSHLFAIAYLIVYHLHQLAANIQPNQDASALLVANGLVDPLLYAVDGDSHLLAAGQLEQQHHNSPGHYEFEVAPKLEPPSVRKPPYQQTKHQCAGSDPLASFSPRDTLCGDLNQGRVPLNPLGQWIDDQAYPFELIKNKTLQFLARALPILKQEYESIPKVARYLPANYFLNPTHQASTLSHDQMNQINQHFTDLSSLEAGLIQPSSQADEIDDSDQLGPSYAIPPFISRRRKRSAVPANGKPSVSRVDVGGSSASQQFAGITVAELSPNASLVVSSAHSSHPNGRILQINSQNRYHYHSNLATQRDHAATIAREQLNKSVRTQPSNVEVNPKATHEPAEGPAKITVNNQGQVTVNNNNNNNNSAKSAQITKPQEAESQQADTNGASTNSKPINTNGQQQVASAAVSLASDGLVLKIQDHQHNQQKRSNNNGIGPDIGANANHDPSNNQKSAHNHATSSEFQTSAHQDQQLQARSVARNGSGRSSGSGSGSGNEHQNSGPSSTMQSADSSAAAKQARIEKRRLSSNPATPCADSSNGFSLAICQAATALIDGSRQPGWLQLVKQLGSIYSTASDNTLWSALIGSQSEAKNSGGAGSSAGPKSSAGGPLVSLLGPLSNLLTGGYPSSGPERSDSTGNQTANRKDLNPGQSLPSAFGTAMARLALAGWASNVISSLVEYFVPTALQSVGRTGFAKRKKINDPREQFVDTPASMTASLKLQQQNNMAGKQPPTPCPSVEEYISPTFARNYQGAWKYVVQIPHEGYFTQTIQRTSCMRQKCEFTEGICHESPRWVSLLVAEIYYPNAVFGRTGHPTSPATAAATSGEQAIQAASMQALASQMKALQNNQPSKSQPNHIQQRQSTVAGPQTQANRAKLALDPLQMIDSSNAYDHNLNAAYLNAASQLASSWADPSAIQLAYNNYQLQQRNGFVPSSQPQSAQLHYSTAEARASVPETTSPMQQQLTSSNTLNYPQSISNQDYIIALAVSALQQNPNMNINELIQSLQLQMNVKRKRRDIASDQRVNVQSAAPNSQNYNSGNNIANNPYLSSRPVLMQKSGQLESVPSVNELNSIPSNLTPISPRHSTSALHQQTSPIDPISQSASNAASGSLQSTAPSSQPDPTSSNQIPDSSSRPNDQFNNQQNQQQHQQQQQSQQSQQQQQQQLDCDGHDKIGCYVVRVYYDWFLVNGSCKCWKTNANSQSGSSTSSTNSFLRRIFTG